MEIDFFLVGKRIKEIRIEKGISQVKMADALGCDPCYVSKMERGAKRISISRIVAVAEALNVSVDTLLGRDGQTKEKEAFGDIFKESTPYERRLILGTIRGLIRALREEMAMEKER